MKEITTIKLSKCVVGYLSKLKVHPRQSYEEVIRKLLQQYKNKKIHGNIAKTPSDMTTIKISKTAVKELSNLKIHPRQSYEEVIIELFEKYKNTKDGKK